MATREATRARLQQLRDRFLAISLRSRTLRLTRPSKSGALDLVRLPPTALAWLAKVLGAPADASVREQATGRGERSSSIKAVAIADVLTAARAGSDEAALSEDVATLAHAARAVFMETGADELAVGFPFLEGRAPDGTWLRAPLFLYPVALAQSKTGKLRWTLAPTGPATLNTTLCETLKRLCGVRLAEDDFLAKDDDALFKVDDASWRAMVDTLRAAGLAVDAPLALPDAPTPVAPRAEAEREALPLGRFALCFHLVLGRFPLSGSTLVLDYDQLLEDPSELGLAAPILAVDEARDDDAAAPAGPGAELAPPGEVASAARGLGALGALRRWQVVPSDKSQDEVFQFLEGVHGGAQPSSTGIETSADLRGLVVQGPPGTGKSQLITNVLAAALAEGQRVLLVCQKRAALDVVAERLERFGLREPIAVVHDVERDRNALCQSISETLAQLAEDGDGDHDKVAAEVDAATARAGKDLAARLDGAQAAWTALAAGPESPSRPSLAALDEALLGRDVDALPLLAPELVAVGRDDVPEGLRAVEALAALAAPYAPPHAFAERTDWAALAPSERTALPARLATLRESCARWAEHATREGLPADVLDAQREALAEADVFAPLVADDPAARDAHALYRGFVAAGACDPVSLASRLRTERKALPSVPPELVALRPAELHARVAKLERLAALERKWWRVFLPAWWLLRGLPKKVLAGVRTKVTLGADATLDLAQLHRDAGRWHTLLAALPEHPLVHLAALGDPATLDAPIERLETGLAIVRLAERLHAALGPRGAPWEPDARGRARASALGADGHASALAPDGTANALVRAALHELPRARALCDLDRHVAPLAGTFTPSFLATLRALAVASPAAALAQAEALVAATPDIAACAELDRLLAPHPAWARTFLRRHRGGPERAVADADAAVLVGWRTLALAARDPKALERPLLDTKLTAGLAAALDGARKVAARGALARWRGRLAAAARDPLERKELQKLHGEVDKKRRRATLRQLQERHGARLGLVRPIWFCSPESVASLFPLEAGLFDLVIFDEASQCPVESAVPALVRARRALVAGDDQQMPPSHFFQASGDDDASDDEEPSTILAAQSILSLARVALRTTTLSWHYRCRHEELIAFSNAAFYGRRLASAPNAERRPRLASEGLHWEAVDGRWKDQTNAVEAERVVDLVAAILAESLPSGAPPTLGIVAMNRPQAELITQRIEARAASDDTFRATLQRDLERPVIDQLFVRNLENVQGDERDVMILSLAYARGDKSPKVHARFGPLGLDGGEKRLNVAITRARLGLWVVASCAPEDLAVEGTTHAGPKLLKAFLAFVRAAARGDHRAARSLLDEAAGLGRGTAAKAPARARPGTALRDAIAAALEARGLVVQKDLGLGRLSLDLAVRAGDDDTFRVGVDTSGWLSREDALLRELYVPLFWQRAGWRLVRVTAGAWARDAKAVVQAIEKALD